MPAARAITLITRAPHMFKSWLLR